MMVKHSKRIATSLLATVLCFTLSFGAGAQAKAKKASAPNGTNWMSAVADKTPLCALNIPGSHDSAMAYYQNSTGNYARVFGIPVYNTGEYACTQELTIPEQLEAGVRFLDLRFSPKSGELRLCHGDADDAKIVAQIMSFVRWASPMLLITDFAGAPLVRLDTEFYAYEDASCQTPSTFQTVMGHIKRFLQEHPSEVLIVKLKRENGEAEDYLRLLGKQMQALQKEVNPATGKPYVYMEEGSAVYTKMPGVAQARGQIVLMCPEYEQIGCGGNLEMSNGTGTAAYMGTNFNFHNHWDIGAQQKLEEVQQYLNTVSGEAAGENALPGSVLHTSSNKIMQASPRRIEEVVGAWLYAKGTLKRGNFYGWFLSDFITAEKSEKIWSTNF